MATSSPYQLPMFPDTKVCTKCGLEKPLEDFWLNAHGRDGRNERCILCAREAQNARYRAKHPAQPTAKPDGATEQCCTACGLVKSLESFARSALGHYGRNAQCKECRNAQQRARRAANIDAEREKARQWREAHRDELRQYHHAYYEANIERHKTLARAWRETHAEDLKEARARDYRLNRERYIARARQWRQDHPKPKKAPSVAEQQERCARAAERKRARDRAYYEAHKDEAAAYSRAYYQQRKEEIKARAAAWVKQNPDRRRANQRRYRQKNLHAYAAYGRLRAARRRAAEGCHDAEDIARIYDDQGGLCYYCSCHLNGKYHVDHKQPVSKGGSEWSENLCAACERCNTRKRDMTEAQFKELLLRERSYAAAGRAQENRSACLQPKVTDNRP